MGCIRQAFRIAVVNVVMLAATSAVAQVEGAGSTGSSATDAAKSPADVAYEPLGRDFNNLYKSLQNKGGIAEEDHKFVRALRDRAAAFSRQFANDVRGPLMEMTLSQWLGETELVDELQARILQLDPDNQKLRFAYARRLASQNRYEDALEVFGAHPPDAKTNPEAALLYADCLFAQQRFQEALDAIANTPDPNTSLVMAPTQQLEKLREAIRAAMQAWPEEQSKRQQEEAANDLPRAVIVTSKGQITVELFENEAPNTVANFINLIDQGFYNGIKFHRVEPNFVAQAGDPNTKTGEGVPGMGGPGYVIPDEHERPDHRNHFTGSVSMANTGSPNTGGSQFFFTVMPTPHLNGKHTVFGRIIDGLDVARSLEVNDVIEAATVIRRRPHEYKPNTLPGVVMPPPVTPPATPATPTTPTPETTPPASGDETPTPPQTPAEPATPPSNP